ncbi:MAG: molecular chaperone TorD family protein [Deltaproteobacteria bacterium]|nr:molecular chaperone TorD family protein [Deltaproteobacteria bacterium]
MDPHAEDLLPHLARSARYRVLSLLFAPPTDGLGEALRALTMELHGDGAPALQALARDAGSALAGDYHRALGPSGGVRDAESDYEVNPLGGKGPLIADVAGFYDAFKYHDTSLEGLPPDHLSIELGYLGWLAFRAAYARASGELEAEALCVRASERFVTDHLGRWARTFFQRVHERVGGGWYDRAATVAEETLAALEPGRLSPPVEDRRRVALPTLDESDECGLPSGA